MALQPPSFFQNRPHPLLVEPAPTALCHGAQTGGGVEGTPSLAPPPAPPPAPELEELRRLRAENSALRNQLQRSTSSATLPLPHTVTASPSPLVVPAMLNSDLLNVETHLRSRIDSLQQERTELTGRLVRAEASLLQAREQHRGELERAEATLLQAREQHRGELERAEATLLQAREQHRGELEQSRVESAAALAHQQGEGARTRRELEATLLEGEVGLREVEEELARCRHAGTLLEERGAALVLELESEKSLHDSEVSRLTSQLLGQEKEAREMQKQLNDEISLLCSSLECRGRRVEQLEAYLGGELPEGGEGGVAGEVGMTWREEREDLRKRIEGCEKENQQLQSEGQLLHIRLSSLSEILSLQEADLAESAGASSPPAAPVKSLLGRWRGKVFALMVQARLREMEQERETQRVRRVEGEGLEREAQLQREKELLCHTLTDRSAELQLQTNATEAAEERLVLAQASLEQLRQVVLERQRASVGVALCLRGVEGVWGGVRTLAAQTLTRLANQEQRLGAATRRMHSLRACLACRMAVQQSDVGVRSFCDGGCQTDSIEATDGLELTSYSRDQLVQEVTALAQERDSLAKQLDSSTEAFETQIRSTRQDLGSRLAVAEERVRRLQGEKAAIAEQLSSLSDAHTALEAETECVRERVVGLEKELIGAQATLQTRVDAAVAEERERSQCVLTDMEHLLEVARREHAKAAVELQQVQRRGARERERAVAAAEMGRSRVEQELGVVRKKLQSVQAERNLLMTTLKQEGSLLSLKRPFPRPPRGREGSTPSPRSSPSNTETDSAASASDDDLCPQPTGNSATVDDPPYPGAHSPEQFSESPGASSTESAQSDLSAMVDEDPASNGVGPDEETDVGSGRHERLVRPDEPAPTGPLPRGTAVSPRVPRPPCEEDIRDVLKDLQLLTASLLGMQPPDSA